MKPITIFFFTLFYLTTYLGINYLINYFFDLGMSFIELLVIGFLFSILLIVLLTFDVPEKIANKIITRNPDNDNVKEIIEEEMVDDFFERKKEEDNGGDFVEQKSEANAQPNS